MGNKHSEVAEEEKMIPYDIKSGSDGDVVVTVEGKDYAPPEISAMILQYLKSNAEDYLGSDLLSDDPRFNNLQKKIGLEN